MMQRDVARLRRDARRLFVDLERLDGGARQDGQAIAPGLREDTARALAWLEQAGGDALAATARDGRRAWDQVRRHPWLAGTAAAAIVVSIGLLARRRRG